MEFKKEYIIIPIAAVAVLGVGYMNTQDISRADTIDSPVTLAKESFYSSAQKLCDVKLDEYKSMIVNDIAVNSADVGGQIDRLKTQEGCYSFASEVLLNKKEETGK